MCEMSAATPGAFTLRDVRDERVIGGVSGVTLHSHIVEGELGDERRLLEQERQGLACAAKM
jgi:hypothetical protein